MRRLILAAVLPGLVALLAAAAWIFLSRGSVDGLEVGPGSADQQQTWHDSVALCDRLAGGWRLPGITELLGIYYWRDDIRLHPRTDYWSADVVGGYGFGLNSNLGWLSFDRLADEDHALCVRRLSQ